ncbi:MAG: carboxypeptidase M32 [Trueperaceae bacterium]|nr:MAG: carboxypeptidase M32 [Trueperaceae bacterium]
MSLEEKLAKLKTYLGEVNDLGAAASLLAWDQVTYMPVGGAVARQRQIALLQRLSHEKFIGREVGRLLDDLVPLEQELDPDSLDACLLRVARRDYEHAVKIPPDFLAKLHENAARSYQAWSEARPANDFSKVVEPLELTLELSRRYGEFFPESEHPADPLIDQSDEGMTVALLRPLFRTLRRELVPLVEAICSQESVDNSVLHRYYPENEQLAFGLKIARDFGYDLGRGRQDKSPHPFATNFSIDDVRITTWVDERDVREALFSTLHESGHAMYEQGVSRSLEGTPLASGVSSGVHESQSRLWENLVGRSRGFWEHYYPSLRESFPEQLGGVSVDSFYRAINSVRKSLVRTKADEVTYNLHVILRFELELELLEGKLAIHDLPDAWRDRSYRYLGITPEEDRDGVLQDVHWYSGAIGGAFQGYSLGNILSAQFYEAAINAVPSIPSEIEAGNFTSLYTWLKFNIYRHGRKYPPQDLIKRATSQDLMIEPYLRYLRTKYGKLYSL